MDATGRLLLIAADHPARGALSLHGRPLALADRYDLINRMVIALSRPGVDGVLATPDLLEDLLVLGALANKVAVGSMNRGGLAGTSFEIDDRFTAFDAQTIADMRFDAGKMLCRICPDDPATARTLQACGRAVTKLARHGLTAIIEPFMSDRIDGRVVNRLSADDVIASMAIAAGLGATSAYTWLKIPVVPDMERVVAATTLPILLLGGDPRGAAEETFAQWEAALTLPGVCGLVVGRALLYPPDDDVAAAVDRAVKLVHPHRSPSERR